MIRHNQFPRLLRSCSTRRIIGLLILLSILASGHAPVWAQSTPDLRILSFEQQDLDGDGTPDLAIIECSCVTPLDRILVFDGGNDMQFVPDWSRGTDFANDTWVYDIRADGNANLIIRFEQSSEHQIASLYDDRNGDGVVAYHVDQGQVLIDESPNWTMQVISTPTWVDAQGNPNLNLKVLQDRPVGAAFLTPELSELFMANDGEPDWVSEMTDSDHDGSPEFMWWRLLADIPPAQYGVGRFFIYSNVGGTKSARPTTAPFWPFLDFRPPLEREARYFDRIPTVTVEWSTSQVTGFLLPGYPTEEGYHIQSLQYVQSDTIGELDHEMPHAYYDLASNNDGYPELNIRLLRNYRQPGSSSNWQEIRYSWNQRLVGPLIWDYKVGLMGDPPIDKVVTFPDFSLRMIPYEDLPYWVTEQPWKLATFVANEGRNSASSEGIYAWTPWHGADPVSATNPSLEAFTASLRYLTGASEHSSQEFFTDIQEGYRGEYHLTGPIAPMLYFSPVDRRLHLKGAEHGLLNLGAGRYVMYDNKDGDPYIDEWTYQQVITGTQPLTLTRHFAVANNYLIYSGDDVLVVRQASVTPSLFETLPPRNHEEWKTLGDRLDMEAWKPAPDDFLAMLRQFDGTEVEIQGARVRYYRPDGEDGFRFVLELTPEYQVSGPDLLEISSLAPGKYVIENHGGVFHANEWAPPDLDIELPPTGLVSKPARQVQTSQIAFQVVNNGLQDASAVIVTGEATDDLGVRTTIGEQEISVASGAAEKIYFAWVPDRPGTHTIALRATALDTDGGGTLAEAEWADTVWVDSAPSTSFRDGVSAFGLVPVTPMLMFLGSLLFVLGVYFVYWWRVRQTA